MKRKIFSKLLMVALVIAAVGSFVSCKDYDDDINNLQKQIDAKAAISELTALQSTLDSKIAAAQSAAAAAQATADAAATKTAVADLKTALETAIADAKKAGTDAGTQAGTAIAAANKAQETADAAAAAAKKADEDAKAALADALKTIEETYQTKADAAAAAAEAAEALAAVKATADAAFTKAEAEKLQEQVNNLKADLEAAIDEKIDEKIKEVNNAVASVDAIWSGVTNVELVPSGKSTIGALQQDELYFLKGIEFNNAFGAAVAPAGNAALPYDGSTISEIKNYKAGDKIKFDNRIYVRVYPANATFTADDVVLLNSKGEALNDLVSIDVEPYANLITRGDYNTGLWVVKFTRKADTTEDNLYAAVGSVNGKYDATDNPMCVGKTLYAIGINNSKDAAEQRYVSTAFELGVNYGDYVAPRTFSFNVIDSEDVKAINTLHNRWCMGDADADNNNKLIGEDKTREAVNPGKWNEELEWVAAPAANAKNYAVAKEGLVDTTSVSKKAADDRNYRAGDSRYALTTYVKVDAEDRSFSIDGIDQQVLHGVNLNLVQWYYVTLDRYAAVESAPSEWESWNSYKYTGLYTVTPAIDRLTITIDSKEAIGDIIGFRVFAVNYDGSLADPDGRAFYVKVGDVNEINEDALSFYGEWTPRVAGANDALTAANLLGFATAATPLHNTGIIAWNKPADVKDGVVSNAQLTNTVALSTVANKINGAAAANATVVYQFLDANKAAFAGDAKLSQIKYIAVGYTHAQTWLDNLTYTLPNVKISVTDPDHHNNIIYTAPISIKKVMPTDIGTFAWKYGYTPAAGKLTIYPQPANTGVATPIAWNTSLADAATFRLSDYATGITAGVYTLNVTTGSGANLKTIFNNAAAENASVADYTWTANADASAAAAGNVGGTFIFEKSYNAEINRAYGALSYRRVNGAAATAEDYFVKLNSLSSITFEDALAPKNQPYTLAGYNYTYYADAAAENAGTLSNVMGCTDYFLFYNADGTVNDQNGNAVTATTLCQYDATNGSGFGKPTLVQSALAGIDVEGIPTAAGMLQALLKGSNVANWYQSAAPVINFTGPFNPDAYDHSAMYFNWVSDADGTLTANGSFFRGKVVAADNTTEFYYANIYANGQIEFIKANGVPATTTQKVTLKIYAVDCFGYGHVDKVIANAGDESATATPIAEIPITLVVE